MTERTRAKIIGGTIGATLALYFLVYLPMKGNYDECGKVTLCAGERP
jgi:hypothetical protein